MPTKTPTQSDFPPHLTVSITSPNTTTTTTRPPPNILLLLHGIGDTSATFSTFGRASTSPKQPCSPSKHQHASPSTCPDSTGVTISLDEVIRGVLVQKCGYKLREIMILGFGQGGMVGLVCARELGVQPRVQDVGDSGANDGGGIGGDIALSGVISIGAPYPISGSVVGEKNRTPVLLVAGRDSEVVSDGAVSRTKGVFDFVEVTRYARRGDGMPKSREEMLPVMRFLARRLRSWQGVPEGSVEIS
ncbi:phospholipase/Carboxylesterase superfamily [Aspergillus nomiae NRRL 13137]|uniref:Phospholipase/Carboxylesterase superfamily n=1 Tax=Aspergillus nomiae NRRL (strain ATCC 15546 / NRRL 13137 / CBS 260.88 / M93) TaxID=1509407 RepID=A0A0L1JFM3_ASPN3|nr:phospholipase/Carboxylesterase superfamily [Aspergillus nomiae NRRL 13137]KNG90497.1 phospholipase/Carboxylesterase superfamily [Aspergillus nomiae NRRL 13137]